MSKKETSIVNELGENVAKVLAPQSLRKIAGHQVRVFKFEDDFELDYDNCEIDGGRGACGEALKATLKSNRQPVILKESLRYDKTELVNYDILKEIMLLHHLNKYPDTKTVGFYGIALNWSETQLYLVLERLDMDLHSITVRLADSTQKNNGKLPSEQYRKIFYQTVKAFNAIHSLGIVHNDIKLANLMIKGDEVKVIDFGMADFLGVGPTLDLVSVYLCTQVTKAPDSPDMKPSGYIQGNRKTYASDMYSIGATMIHLVLRNYYELKNNKNLIERGFAEDESNEWITEGLLNAYLSEEEMLGKEGLDLILKITEPDVTKRWCAKEALLHPYFNGLNDENSQIDRNIVGGADNFYEQSVRYIEEQFRNHTFELCYLEDLHQNYKNDLIELKPISIKKQSDYPNMNTILNDWLIELLIQTEKQRQHSRLHFYGIYSIDAFINGLLLLRVDMGKRYDISTVQLKGILYPLIYEKMFQYNETELNKINELLDRKKYTIVSEYRNILKDNINNLDIHPVSVHLQYIVVKLQYELADPRILPILEEFYNRMCYTLILVFINHDGMAEQITMWELSVFSANYNLSKLLDIPAETLCVEPIAEFLRFPVEKYKLINEFIDKYFEFLNSQKLIPFTLKNISRVLKRLNKI